MNDYELNQGELFRVTIELEDGDCNPIKLASVSGTGAGKTYTTLIYFAGVATLEGQNAIPLEFVMLQEEVLTYGRGFGRTTDFGVYKVDAYLSADTTISMAAGTWNYEVRESNKADPADADPVSTVLEGTLTIIDGALDNADGAAFTFGSPANPS